MENKESITSKITIVSDEFLSGLKTQLNRIEEKLNESSDSKSQEKDNEKLMTANEIAAYLQVSRGTIQRLRNDGKLKFIKLNGKLYVKKSDLKEAINNGFIN